MLGVDETGMAALWQRNRRHGKWTAGTLPPTHLRDVGKVVEAAPERWANAAATRPVMDP